MPVECLKCLSLFKAALGYFYGMSRVLSEGLGISGGVLGVSDGVWEARGAIFPSISLNFRKSQIISLTF